METSFSTDSSEHMAERDVGLGTAYERVAIYRRILHWYLRTRPESAAEGPLDGMAGMPGLHLFPLARLGLRVTVVSPSGPALERVRAVYDRAGLGHRLETLEASELPARRFDWVLSFNALPLVKDWRAFLASLAPRARSLVVFVSNPWSYGTWIVRARRIRAHAPKPALFDHASTRRRGLEAELSSLGKIEDSAWVDCPWWPDLFVETGNTLAGSLGLGVGASPRFVYDPASFPYTNGEAPPELRSRLRRHPDFETSRLAPIFAHHRAYLVTRT